MISTENVRRFCTIASCAAALVLAIATTGQDTDEPAAAAEDVAARLRGADTPPDWAEPRPMPYMEGSPWTFTRTSRTGVPGMRDSVAQLRYGIHNNPTSMDRPYLLLVLGTHYAELGEDRLAYQELGKLLDLPPTTRHNGRIYRMPTLESVQEEGRFELARILARNGLAQEAGKQVAGIMPRHGYDRVRLAEIYMLMGDRDRTLAHLREMDDDGHPDRRYSKYYLRLRAVLLAQAVQAPELAREIARPVLSKPDRTRRRPEVFARDIMLTILAAAPVKRPLKDGEYDGACEGYVGILKVRVEIKDGRIAAVTVTSHEENRPWSALQVVPERILRAQSIKVDAVSGATATSGAVIAAVARALSEAAR